MSDQLSSSVPTLEIGHDVQAAPTEREAYALEILRALRVNAILRPGLSQAEVIQAAIQQVEVLGLRGTISMLDEGKNRLVIRALAFPNQKKLTALERLTGLHVLGFSFPVQGVDAYRAVVETGKPVFLLDSSLVVAQLVPETHRGALKRILRVFAPQQSFFAPICVAGQIGGVLSISARVLGEADQTVAEVLASQTGMALENARLYGQSRQQAKDLATLYEAGQLFSSTLEQEKVFQKLCLLCTGVLNVDLVLLRLIEDGKLVIRGSFYRYPKEQGVLERLLEENPILVGMGIAGRVAQTGEPAMSGDAPVEMQTLLGYVDYLRRRRWLVVPMRVRDRIIGALTFITDDEARSFSPRDLSLAQEIANQAAIAAENARLYETIQAHAAKLEEKARNLGVVYQVSSLASSSLDPEHILNVVVEQMTRLFEVDHCGILLFDRDQTYGQVAAEHPASGALGIQYPVKGYPAAERIIADPQPLFIEDTQRDPLTAPVREAMHQLGIRSMLILPLVVKGDVIGSIGLDAVVRPRCFTEDEVALAQSIAQQV